ncbi:MAG: PTS glucose transporter subunit IIA [Actinomycetaceae bacterium]|nr:PTS glucose transporter subunit IIA [Actinomycetaceae bacterium]
MISVYSPLSGSVLALHEVDDPVLAEGIVGHGCAVTPVEQRWHEVCAPVDGRILKVLPHAFLVFTPAGIGVIVHMGINTVKLHGQGFEVLRSEGDEVSAGDVVVRWDSSIAKQAGMATSVSVIACDLPAEVIKLNAPSGRAVQARDLLFEVSLPTRI